MEQELLLKEVQNSKMRILTESLQTNVNEAGGVTISGLALPFKKVSRNGFEYVEESIRKTYETLIGKPVLFNHNIDRVIGHIKSASLSEEGLIYEMDIDPEERDIIRKVKRGDLKNVSIQVMYDKDKSFISEDGITHAYINEFLELSLVTIPGFGDTTAYVVEQLKNKEDFKDELIVFLTKEEVDSKYQNPDGTFKKMTDPKNPNSEPSKFYGCVRYQISQGKDYDSAVKICAYIKQKKKSYFEGDENMSEEEIKNKEQSQEPDNKDDNDKKDDKDPMEELLEKIKALEKRISALEKSSKKEDNEEGNTPEEGEKKKNEDEEKKIEEALKQNKTVVMNGIQEEKKVITTEDIKNAFKNL